MWIAPADHKRVGEYLEALRKSVGLTQQQLAKRLGKPQSFVSAYESGQRRIDLLELARIVSALDHNVHTVCLDILNRVVTPRKRTGSRL